MECLETRMVKLSCRPRLDREFHARASALGCAGKKEKCRRAHVAGDAA